MTERGAGAGDPGDVLVPVSHLPLSKQRALRDAVQALGRMIDIEAVILFGSHARGDWLDDGEAGYTSDYDLLVLLESPRLAADEAVASDCADRVREAVGDTPITLIFHTVEEVNAAITKGNSFFRDVISEGILLCSTGRLAIANIEPLTTAQHLALAERSFPRYLERAEHHYAGFEYMLARSGYAVAILELRRAAEATLKTVLLVFTAYIPKTHDIARLEELCARSCPELSPVVPPAAADGERLSGLLYAACLYARECPSFVLLRNDLRALAAHVDMFRARTRRACEARIASLAKAAREPTAPSSS